MSEIHLLVENNKKKQNLDKQYLDYSRLLVPLVKAVWGLDCAHHRGPTCHVRKVTFLEKRKVSGIRLWSSTPTRKKGGFLFKLTGC